MADRQFTERFINARQAVIKREFKALNDMQVQAVMQTEGPLLILAGAGSGKTTVLINRIGNIIKYGRGSCSDELPYGVTQEDLELLEKYAMFPDPSAKERAERLCAIEPCEPWRIIAITFTNKAADELKARLEKMLGEAAMDVWAMTFHSACVRILRRYIDRLGYDLSFTIYDANDQQSLIKRIISEQGLDDKMFPPRTVAAYISNAKDAMMNAADFCADAEKAYDVRRREIGKVYREYEARMKKANALDFDDLIMLTVRLLQENPDVLDYYQRKFKYVLVDEYQDTNHLQYLMTSLLAGGSGNICVVGDDDQSIYKFRGATIENILSFEHNYKNAKTIRLEQNYRSKGHILAAANAVIANNKGRKGKNLWTDKDMGDRLMNYIAADEREEAQYVAGKIMADVASGGRFSDNAILYRMNAQSNSLEYAMKRNAIPYRIIGGTRFFDRAEVKDMLAYMCVINEPADDLRLLRIINQPPRGIGAKTIETVSDIASVRGVSIMEILRSADQFEALERPAAKLRSFASFIDEMRAKSGDTPLDVFYDELIDKTGYVRMLEAKPSDENATRLENVKELKSNIANYMKENEGGTLFGFLDEIALYTDIDKLNAADDCVVMMTIHSSKGLEFPNVYIVGVEEGIFPGTRAIGEPDEMEEERRLCYVAMTRAMEKLYLTCARQRMLFGRTTAGQPSRFIGEIKTEDIIKPSPAPGFSFGGPDFDTESPYMSFNYTEHFGSKSYGRQSYKNEKKPVKKTVSGKPAGKPLPDFKKGDLVQHKAFGKGMVVSLQPMGGDALIEVAFDDVGTKRLMLRSASEFMKKI